MVKKSKGSKTPKRGAKKESRSSTTKRTSRTSSTSTDKDTRTTGTGTGAPQDILSSWMKFQEDLGKQINEVIEAQQRYNKEMSKRWTGVTDDMNTRMNKVLSDDRPVEDLQRMWERYMKDMNRNLETFLESESKAFDDLYARWKPLSEEMNKAVASLSTSKDVKAAQQKMLDSWLKISREMTEQMTKSIKMGTKELKGLRTVFNNMMGDMEALTKKFQDTDPETAASIGKWTDASRKMNDLFMAQMDTDMEEMVRRQDFWLNTMTDMSTSFVKAMWETNQRMFEGSGLGPKRSGR